MTDPELAKRVRPSYHPYLVNELVITAPGNTGGSIEATGADLYAFDARSGAQLFKHPMGRGTRASPLTYRACGTQHVAIVVMNIIPALAIPNAK